MFDLKHANQALWNGNFGGELVKLFDHENIYAFERTKNGDRIVCILNLSSEDQNFNAATDTEMTDVFSGETISWAKDEEVSMGAWEYIVLSKTKN